MLKRFNPLDWYNALRCRMVYHPRHLYIRHPDIRGWQWHDRDHIMLCAVFQILVDFVEQELPQFNRFCGMDTEKHQWIYRLPFLSWYLDTKRNPQAGIEHLQWAMSLTHDDGSSTSQAQYAAETLALYRWWTIERPARLDPWEQVSETRIPIKDLFKGEDGDGEKARYFEELRLAGAVEELYHDEDEAQLIRLMKVRRGLWT